MSPLLQVLVICTITWVLWKFIRKLTTKRDIDNIPGPKSPSFIYGNIKQLYSRQGWAFHRGLGEKFGPVVRLRGKFGQDIIYTFDPKAMHHIAVKDQEIFQEAMWFTRMMHYLFGDGLLATLGDQHRRQRKMLNPVFSINHMRHMTPIFYNVCHKLGTAIEDSVRKGQSDGAGEGAPVEVDLVNWMGRTALELMGQAGLGYSFDPLTVDASDEFGAALKDLIPAMAQTTGGMQYIPFFEAIVPRPWRRTVAKHLPSPTLRKIITIVDTLWRRSSEIYAQKKEALLSGDEAMKHQVGEGKDLMSILLKVNMEAAEEDKLPEEELIGQMCTLTFAAMDTTSNALSLTLWRLAQNPDVQDKVRAEILAAREVSHSGDIAYDDLVSLPYLDAICRETLRVHVPSPFRFREARKDIVLPLSEPIQGLDGRLMHEIFVPKDTSIFVGISAANTNKALWGEDAYEWKPERWLEQLPEKVLDAKIPGVYANLMTFWGGGRACIGFKFSQLEMKVVLAVLISKFTFALPKDKHIYWNLAGIIYPSTDAKGEHPWMPLQVGLVAK
ncbi:cytochrome P450 [Trametes meyenii]|nr:cytochrome P450 [Trametes meyenii]